MANIILPNAERQEITESVMRSYGVGGGDTAGREAAEVIAARSMEAREQGEREGGKRIYGYH